MHSAIYRGWLRHRRVHPRAHAFRYPLYMMYLDLAELDEVFRGRWLWSVHGSALVRFAREDHLGEAAEPLDACVRDLVRRHTGRLPEGPIRLLTHLRHAGYVFNPVSFHYCFDAAGCGLQAIVAEVNNTPWGERCCYVLEGDDVSAAGGLRTRSEKAMHVSPFMPMTIDYDWHFGSPGERLGVHIALREAAGEPPVFDATLALTRVPISGRALAGVLLRYPLMTAQVIAAIHWQALRLWIKRLPLHPHPKSDGAAAVERSR